MDLVVTSPPYPMIEMWDDLFVSLDTSIKKRLVESEGAAAFEKMHTVLDPVWKEVFRVVKPGGFACINIGDATRKLGVDFRLYSNHSRIIQKMTSLGFSSLPMIIWRKQTNAPNKFMGSGMLPAGAYVTLEHEYILIFRKGAKREFRSSEEKLIRQQSAIFWEERNLWFSDVWMDLKGASQSLNSNGDLRLRSAAFPFDLPFRIINMYSRKGDIVLDPFLGSGTTTLAAIACARNSIGIELDPEFKSVVFGNITEKSTNLNTRIEKRLADHKTFIDHRIKSNKAAQYTNHHYGVNVVTRQEKNLFLNRIKDVQVDEAGNEIRVTYSTPDQ